MTPLPSHPSVAVGAAERIDGEATMADALRPFGWTCGPEFWRRYYTDPWLFNLANAVERLSASQCTPEERAVVDAAIAETKAETTARDTLRRAFEARPGTPALAEQDRAHEALGAARVQRGEAVRRLNQHRQDRA